MSTTYNMGLPLYMQSVIDKTLLCAQDCTSNSQSLISTLHQGH